MSVSAEARFIFVETRAAIYRQQAESGVGAIIVEQSQAAVTCFDLADLISQGVDLFESIGSLDEDWRLLVFENTLPYDKNFEQRVVNLYKLWLAVSEHVLSIYERLAAEYNGRGFDGARVQKLHSAVREAKGVLTDDAAFVADDALVNLRDEALDSHAKGQTFEHGPA